MDTYTYRRNFDQRGIFSLSFSATSINFYLVFILDTLLSCGDCQRNDQKEYQAGITREAWIPIYFKISISVAHN